MADITDGDGDLFMEIETLRRVSVRLFRHVDSDDCVRKWKTLKLVLLKRDKKLQRLIQLCDITRE